MSYNAYKRAQTGSETPQQTEYRLFTDVTRALTQVIDAPRHNKELIEAIDWNRRIWSTLSTDCSIEGNQLPKELRAGIISLAIWVSKHSSMVMRGEESVEDLISINRTIMEGLADQHRNMVKAKQEASPEGTTNFTGASI